MHFSVIGASNIDITAQSFSSYIPHDSNPGFVKISYGGVSRNIAYNLALLQQKVTFFTALGNDSFASGLENDCKKVGIDLQYALHANQSSSVYISINDENGNLQSAVSDMAIVNSLDIEYLQNHTSDIFKADGLVFDANLCEESMAFLIDNCKSYSFFDTVSCKKAPKIANVLSKGNRKISVLKTNHLESGAIFNRKMETVEEYRFAADQFHNWGVETVFITLGEKGVFASNRQECFLVKAPRVNIVNVNGAGDSFLSAVAVASLNYKNLFETTCYGLSASALALQSDASVSSNISQSKLLQFMKDYHYEKLS